MKSFEPCDCSPGTTRGKSSKLKSRGSTSPPQPLSEEFNLDECLREAVNTAHEAGNIVLEGFHTPQEIDLKLGPWDLVTQYDTRIEALILSKLGEKFPMHKFIGEETETAKKGYKTKLTDDPTWIVDPIDGTTNFVHGLHETCISIALSVNKELVVGVVYNPVLKHLFTAHNGGGAFLNGERIHVAHCTEVERSLVGIEASFARAPELRDKILRRVNGLATTAQGIRVLGSAALALCYLASGRLDAYQADGLQCWDVAAGVVIAREAGGTVVDITGGPFELMKNTVLVTCNEKLAHKLVDVIREADERK